jgi:hypothetical protein
LLLHRLNLISGLLKSFVEHNRRPRLRGVVGTPGLIDGGLIGRLRRISHLLESPRDGVSLLVESGELNVARLSAAACRSATIASSPRGFSPASFLARLATPMAAGAAIQKKATACGSILAPTRNNARPVSVSSTLIAVVPAAMR